MNEIPRGRSVTVDMAHRFGMEPGNFEKVLRATVVPANCSPEQFAAFLLVAKQYSLNPITREIYAFPARGGGIQPIVGIDGWIRIINDQPAMNGMEFRDRFGDDPKVPDAITCLIYRKDRDHPTVVTEYMAECYRDTEPWKKWPARMLRHKAAIQAARYAFGFSGIIDPDEYERGVGSNVSRETFTPPEPPRDVLSGVVSQYNTPEESYTITEAGRATIADKLTQSLKLTEEESNEIDPEPEVAEAMDPDAYLDDLDSRLSTAKTQEDIEEIRQEHLALEDTLMPPDRDKADFIIARHQEQLDATLRAEAAPKRKK
jgi:phage recombination protein Bet